MHRFTILLTLGLLAACIGEDKDGDGNGNGEVPDDPAESTLLDGLTHQQQCEDFEFEGQAIITGTAYFVGDFAISGDDISGWEYWVIFPDSDTRQTDDWSDYEDGESCMLVWEFFGTKGDPISCNSCDFSITWDAYPDPDASNCPQRLYDYEGVDMSSEYDVRVGDDGTATFYYTTGTELATGSLDGDHLTYISAFQCKLF